MKQQDYCFRIDEKSIKNISKSIANEVADKIYCEFLLARYMPEVLAIEKGSVAPIKTEDFKQQLMSRINSMAK
jgi:ethanolamine utilization protein EutQ (cupin superfamily)